MRINKKAAAAAAVAAVTLAGTGVAYAYWTTTGAGTGSATVGSDVAGDAIQIAQFSTNTGFYPGSPVQTISIKATNPAAYNQVVGEVTVTMAATPGCALTNWTLTQIADNVGNVAAGQTSASNDVATLKLDETGLNQDGCKGDVPVLTFSSVGGE